MLGGIVVISVWAGNSDKAVRLPRMGFWLLPAVR